MDEAQLFHIEATVTDLEKPVHGGLSTGIGFLDHMLDQFNSHAQIGISMQVRLTQEDAATDTKNHNRLADTVDQAQLLEQVGQVLGRELGRLLAKDNNQTASSFFACPLDEALVQVQLQHHQDNGAGSLEKYNLAPYAGRTRLGHLQLAPLQVFWEQVAQHAHLQVAFDKIRGDNAHHIVEASFKAFSRALRNLLDGTNTTITTDQLDQPYGPDSANAQASRALQRTARVVRNTKETSIDVQLWLDGGGGGTTNGTTKVSMGLELLNQFWTTVSDEAHVTLHCTCRGDLWIDEHHTAEDVAIAMGQVWNQALGTKAGLNRMWCATVTHGTARVLTVLDLSNRPMLTHNLPLSVTAGGSEYLDDVPIELLEHVLDSFVVNSRFTLQIHVTPAVTDDAVKLSDAWQGVAVGLGQALRYAILVDQRRAGATASSKGTLSV